MKPRLQAELIRVKDEFEVIEMLKIFGDFRYLLRKTNEHKLHFR